MAAELSTLEERFLTLLEDPLVYGEDDELAPVPGLKPFVKVNIDGDYLLYMNRLIGQIPGTETLKINCAFSSLFVLGFTTTHALKKETRSIQVKRYKEHTKLGRNIVEIATYIYSRFLTKRNDAGVLKGPSLSRVRYRHHVFQMQPSDIFATGVINFIKYYLPGTESVKLGSKSAGAAATPHTFSVPQATLINFGTLDFKRGHFVVVLNMEGKLFMIDYQQQLIIAEEDIWPTMLSLCKGGSFRVRNLARAGAIEEVEGFGYVDSITSDTVRQLYVGIYLTADEKAKPLYEGGSQLSLGIFRRMDLFRQLQTRSPRLTDIVGREIDRAVRFLAAKQIERREFLVLPGESFRKRTPALMARAAAAMAASKGAVVDAILGELFDAEAYEVEASFMPDAAFPEKVVRAIAEIRARHILDPAEKGVYVEDMVARDKEKSGGQVSLEADLDMLREELRGFIALLFDAYFEVPAGGKVSTSVPAFTGSVMDME